MTESDGRETCPLCLQLTWLEQDHDHRTDFCRGRICHSCNLLLGRFDRPIEEIQRFLDYIRFWSAQHASGDWKTYTAYMRELYPDYKRGRRAPRTRRPAATVEAA